MYEAQITSNRRQTYGSHEYRVPRDDNTTKRETLYRVEQRPDISHTNRISSKKCHLEVARCFHGHKVAYSLSRDMAAMFEIEARFVKMSSTKNAFAIGPG